jgi:16S rRNA (guanine966-N2)-methyltransferase
MATRGSKGSWPTFDRSVRIVAGDWRGRRIKAPAGDRVRPTADRIREAWMSIVQPRLPGAAVLDLFAGSGALGLEALSRGAASAVFVEIAPASLRALGDNIETLGAEKVATVRRADALRFAASLPPHAFDVAFADPPYGRGDAARLATLWQAVPFARLIGIEHRSGEPMPPGGDSRRYGDTVLTFYDSAGGG